MPNADLVLEGGGVKGLGLIGAIERLMRAGYSFQRVAGTSAGSIVAALVAAGAGADQLAEVMDRLDYAHVPDRGPPGVPGVSESISLLRSAGAYEGDYLREFVAEELGRLGVRTFGDLRRSDRQADTNLKPYQRYKLVVMATDVTRGRLLRLPWDYRLLGLKPDEQFVADAVRASCSIPLFFEPVIVRDGKSGEQTTLVDGGVLSNFPIEIFDSAQLLPGIALPALQVIQLLPPAHLLEQVVATAIVGHDQTYLERPCVRRRTIQVDTGAVGIVEFDASKEKRETVAANGTKAAEQFLEHWDWERYKKECRGATNDE